MTPAAALSLLARSVEQATATLGAIDALRNNIVFNLQGAALPGFAQRRTRLALKSSLVQLRGGQVADANVGGRSAVLGGPAELRVADSTFDALLMFRGKPLQCYVTEVLPIPRNPRER